MATHLRLSKRRAAQPRRFTIGLSVSSRCSRLGATLSAFSGRGIEARAEIAAVVGAPIPKEISTLFRRLSVAGTGSADMAPPEAITLLRAQLAEIEASLVAELLGKAAIGRDNVLAVGVHDPGLWTGGRGLPRGCLGLCDAARVAELTGLNVIDAFAVRDLAKGGQGGPITALAEWILLRDPQHNRLLLDLGRTVRMSYLPADRALRAAMRIISFEVGPGTRLLDLLARRLTDGQHEFDPGGHLAVQGRRIPELVEHWMADPYFERPLPRWHPRGVRPERFLSESLQMALDSGWSIRDLLCTATHFIAEAIAKAVRRLPDDTVIDQVVVAGGGERNGMLLREISARLPDLPVIRIGELGISNSAIAPAVVAVLAILHVDRAPANSTAITGAETARVLGRLTPGSPQNWQVLLHEIAGGTPAVGPLRMAL